MPDAERFLTQPTSSLALDETSFWQTEGSHARLGGGAHLILVTRVSGGARLGGGTHLGGGTSLGGDALSAVVLVSAVVFVSRLC
jgi:hypothetical protein